jgi:hypothetical protein
MKEKILKIIHEDFDDNVDCFIEAMNLLGYKESENTKELILKDLKNLR